MVAPIYSSKKGIYKDLYREIDADNRKKAKEEEASLASRPKKGIYVNLYRQIEEDKAVSFKSKKEENKEKNIWHSYPLKACAYSNDVGEAIRPIIGSFSAKLSWIPTIIYGVFSILNKCPDSENKKSGEMGREIIFQLFASFLFPLLLVKSVGKATHKILDNVSIKTKENIKNSIKQIDWLHKFGEKFKNEKMNQYRVLCESSAGLFALALAAKPIDNFVDNSLNRVYNRG